MWKSYKKKLRVFVIVVMCLCLFLATGWTAPVADIKANDSDGPVSVTTSDTLSIKVSLNAGGNTNGADWWVLVHCPDDQWYYYNLSSGTFRPGINATYQGALFDIVSYQVFNSAISTATAGVYTLYFGVDMTADSAITMGDIYYDSVVVNVSAGTTSTLIYHGVATHSWSNLVTPGGNQTENLKAEVSAYEAAAGRTVSFVEFAHEWKTDGPAFPVTVATAIKNRGATPFIFLNLRSTDVAEEPDPIYNLAAIISGEFDTDFAAWADAAKNFGSEIIVSWGWEMNGAWSAWSGTYNGGPVEGPKRFREAYRHIVELMRNRGASNIRWAFHINFPEYPDEPWNAFENYYPGNDVIDIVGASIYSAQSPADVFFPSFESLFDPAYSRLVKMTPQKPVFVFEFGAAANHPLGSSATWADDALSGILSGRWPTVRGFAWWNDYWSQDDNSAHDTEMRVEAVSGLAAAFKSRLSGADNVGDRPPIFK